MTKNRKKKSPKRSISNQPTTSATISDSPPSKKGIRQSLWSIYIITLFLGALLISWHTLAPIDYGYSKAYQWLSIQTHINRYAPLNQFRKHFATTTTEEHERLFSEIVTSIQNSGEGLTDISYTYNGQSIPLLHEAEVIHLQDVAVLIDNLYPVGLAMIALSVLLMFTIYRLRLPPPGIRQATAGLGVLLLTIALALLIVGPKDLFYWLHVQIFPEGHQWFFYYQESLMTTLMKAPDLFGLMAAFIGGWAILLYSLLLSASIYLQKKACS